MNDTAAAGPAEDPNRLEDIIVQARRTSELQQRVPVAISTVSGDRLAQASATSVDDVQRLVPDLKIQPGPTGSLDFTIRGSFLGVSVDPAVVTYIDEVPTDPRTIVYSIFDLDSVQQVKGPQGTLFGRNSTGGAVLFFSKKPRLDSVGGYVNLRYGNYDERRAEGAINVSITSSLAVRVAGQVERRDGQLKSVTVPGLEFDNRHNFALRASALWQPSDALENYTVATHYRVRENRYPPVIFSLARPCTSPVTPAPTCLYQPPFNTILGTGNILAPFLQQLALPGNETVVSNPTTDDVDRDSITNSLTLRLGEVSLRNILTYNRTRIGYSKDFDGTPARVVDVIDRFDNRTFYTETQLFGKLFDDRLDWRVGGVYSDDKSDQTENQANFVLPTSIVTPSDIRSITNFRSKALFAQGTADLSRLLQGLSLTAGYRHTWDDRDISTRDFGGFANICQLQTLPVPATGAQPFPSADLATCTRRLSLSSNDGNYNFSLDWKISRDVLVYAATRRGYKSGGFNSFETNPVLSTYAPETVKDVELGLKADWRVGTVPVRTNVALFRSRYTNIQTTTVVRNPSSGAITILILNRDPVSGVSNKATIKGLEAEVTVAPTRWLQLNAFYTKLDGKYDQFIAPTTGADLAGESIDSIFPNSYGITARVNVPISRVAGRLDMTASYFRTSDPLRNSLTADTTIHPNQESLDARIALHDLFGSGVELAAFGRNLQNKQKCEVTGLVIGSVARYCFAPRTYGLELGFRFGGDRR